GEPGDLLAVPADPEHANRLVRELEAAVRLALPPPFLQGCVRLRDVAREGDEEADRVLGRGDDRRFGRVRDDDSAARRGLDVDVVDAHSRPPDHFQLRRSVDQVSVQLGRRADHDRVVVADPLREIRVAIEVDVEALLQEPHAGFGDLLPNEDPGPAHTCARSAYASSARVTAMPRSISAPASARASSSAASAVVMSKTSNQPMWPIRTILPFSSPCPFAIVIPTRSRNSATTRVASMPSGARIAVAPWE